MSKLVCKGYVTSKDEVGTLFKDGVTDSRGVKCTEEIEEALTIVNICALDCKKFPWKTHLEDALLLAKRLNKGEESIAYIRQVIDTLSNYSKRHNS